MNLAQALKEATGGVVDRTVREAVDWAVREAVGETVSWALDMAKRGVLDESVYDQVWEEVGGK